MKNGDLDAKGIITSILYDVGTTESFKVNKLKPWESKHARLSCQMFAPLWTELDMTSRNLHDKHKSYKWDFN